MGELDQLPPAFSRMLMNDCSDPVRQWNRQGQLLGAASSTPSSSSRFNESTGPTLRSSASATEVPWADNEPWGRKLEEMEPTFRLESLPAETHSLSSEPWPRMDGGLLSED